MRGSIFYGSKGRAVSAVAGFAGVLAALVAAAQQTNLFSLFPPSWTPYITALPIVSLFFTVFAERLQGGASRPDVRLAAERADQKYAREEYTDRGDI